MDDLCSFSLKHYRHTLEMAKEKGYSFLTMHEYVVKRSEMDSDRKIILIRHDIDLDLDLALNFLEIENELGIPATYFIRIHGKYNPLFYKNYKVIKQISDSGQEIGLHHDCDFAALFGKDPEGLLKHDLEILQKIIEKPVVGISSHEPNNSRFKVGDEDLRKFNLAYQAYSPIFLEEMKYISDSSSRWREGCMCEFIKKKIRRLCILTHPFWWYHQSPLQNH